MLNFDKIKNKQILVAIRIVFLFNVSLRLLLNKPFMLFNNKHSFPLYLYYTVIAALTHDTIIYLL
jgi:hypothetical protein